MRQMLLILACCLSLWLGDNVTKAWAQVETFDLEDEASEEHEELETDRDAFTPYSSTAGKHLTIVESSYSFIDTRDVADTNSFPELLVRYGISDQIEFRLGWNYEVGGSGESVSGGGGGSGMDTAEVERESQLLYGVKLAMTEQDGWVPRSATIVQGYTPTSGEATATDVVVAYTFGWELVNGMRLDSCMRYGTETLPEDTYNLWAPSVVLRAPITERWNIHAEYFGIYSQGAAQEFNRAFFSPGTHYLLTENLELGFRFGWGLTDDSPLFFSNVGVGWRF